MVFHFYQAVSVSSKTTGIRIRITSGPEIENSANPLTVFAYITYA